jgi:methylphosphotriester-DNA--protein-cysteine methyltransferase
MHKVLYGGRITESNSPGKYAGWAPGKIFGRLDCSSGMRMKKENRVFFLTLEDAVNEGYRPCMNCKPISEEEFETIRNLIPQYSRLADFYRGKKK